jgi:hypothetical protein
MDEEAFDADKGAPPTDNGFSGLVLHTGSIEAPSTSMPDLAPRVEGGRVASFDQHEAGALHEGDAGEDDDDGVQIGAMEETARRDRQKRLRASQHPTQYSSADRVLSDDVFRELIESAIRDFEEEHAHIYKHYTFLGNHTNFSNVKCSPHAVQVISDAFEDFIMKLLRRAHVFFSARVRTNEIIEDLALKSNTFGADHRMLINMRICNESEIKRKKEHDMIESIQKQRDEEAAAEEDNIDGEEQLRSQAQRVEQKKANSKVVTMEEVNKARDIMAKKGGQGLLVKSWAVKAQQSFVSTVPVELEKVYSDTEAFFKKISEHPMSGQEVSNVHEIQAEIKKAALRSSRMQESEWRALRLDDIVPVMDAEPTLRRKMVTLYGHELIQSKNNMIIQEELKRRRDAAALNEEEEDQWTILRDIKKLCSFAGSSDELADAAVVRLEEELTKKYTGGKLRLPAAIRYYKQFIEGGGGKGSLKKVNPNMHRSIIITSMLSSKVKVERLPQAVTQEEVEKFLARCNVFGLKSVQFDSHGTNAVLEFHMPKFAQECVARVDAQRMRPSDLETLKVSLNEATRLEPGNILIAERYEKDVDSTTVTQLLKNVSNFKGTCKPAGASHCFVEFVDSSACAAALNKVLATDSDIHFRYVSQNELFEFRSAREKEREVARQLANARVQPQTAHNKPQPVLTLQPQRLPSLPESTGHSMSSSASTSALSSGIFVCVSGVPADIGNDELKQRMSVHPGCVTQSLRSRISKPNGLQSIALSSQEFQVQFQDDESASACLRAMQHRPFLESRPEYGDIVIKKFVLTQEEIDKRRSKMGQAPQANVVREEKASVLATSSAPAAISNPSVSNIPLQNMTDVLTFIYASNIPLMSKEDMTRKFMPYFSSSTPKIEARQDPKVPGTCNIRVLFVDYASAQRCLDALNGQPFSSQHDIGPVRMYIKQLSKDQERLKKQQQQLVVQASAQPQQQSQQHVTQPLQLQQSQNPSHVVQHSVPYAPLSMPVNYAQQSVQSYSQPVQTPMHQYVLPNPPHMSTSVTSAVSASGMMPQSIQMQPMQPHTQLMMMAPSNQPHHFYQQQQQQQPQQQQQQPVHMHQQLYNPATSQQMLPQPHQYPQPQLFSMHPAMQHVPAPQFPYQTQQPVMQYRPATSPQTAADMQALEQEEREIQEKLNALQKKAGQM